MIVPADISDGKLLTDLALASKAFWGYSKDLVESWRADLTVTSKMLVETKTFKFFQEKKVAGFYMLIPSEEENITLEMLFVLPSFIGKGIGKKLLLHAFGEAKKLNTKGIILLSDPNAEAFYKSYGFKVIGKKESSVKNRFLPVMQKDLTQ